VGRRLEINGVHAVEQHQLRHAGRAGVAQGKCAGQGQVGAGGVAAQRHCGAVEVERVGRGGQPADRGDRLVKLVRKSPLGSPGVADRADRHARADRQNAQQPVVGIDGVQREAAAVEEDEDRRLASRSVAIEAQADVAPCGRGRRSLENGLDRRRILVPIAVIVLRGAPRLRQRHPRRIARRKPGLVHPRDDGAVLRMQVIRDVAGKRRSALGRPFGHGLPVRPHHQGHQGGCIPAHRRYGALKMRR
jgi:hypothetical protein